jgi:5-methylcytosine-specific restriction endonuclease McrA
MSVPGTSRCEEHGYGNWQRRQSAPRDYKDPLYLANRAELLRGKPLCHWCGKEPATTADHLERALGHEVSNLVPACERCNRLRGASLGRQVAKLNRGRRTEDVQAQEGPR